MPEGPSILILKELTQQFIGKRILKVEGNAKLELQPMEKQIIRDIKSWGKHYLICFDNFTLRIHLMMFGTYRINERKESPPRVSFQFKNSELNFYTCSLKYIEGDINDTYDFTADVLSDTWDAKKARKKLKAHPDMNVCDALMNQEIFSGVGNIIKNEVLYRIYVHPENTIGDIPPRKLTELINEARNYSYDFLKWKKEFTLKKHWLIYTKKKCKRCNLPALKKYIGKGKRRTFYCEGCQVLWE